MTEPTRESPRFRVEDWWQGAWFWPGNGTSTSAEELLEYVQSWRGYRLEDRNVKWRIVKFWTEIEVVR